MLFFLEMLKKSTENEKKKKLENDQSTGHFQSFFFRPPDPKSEKKFP